MSSQKSHHATPPLNSLPVTSICLIKHRNPPDHGQPTIDVAHRGFGHPPAAPALPTYFLPPAGHRQPQRSAGPRTCAEGRGVLGACRQRQHREPSGDTAACSPPALPAPCGAPLGTAARSCAAGAAFTGSSAGWPSVAGSSACPGLIRVRFAVGSGSLLARALPFRHAVPADTLRADLLAESQTECTEDLLGARAASQLTSSPTVKHTTAHCAEHHFPVSCPEAALAHACEHMLLAADEHFSVRRGEGLWGL